MGTTFAAVLRLAAIRAALALAPKCYEWNAATDGVAAAARRAQFAADIWRKAPLLIRGALDAEALDRACDVDLLAGLALEDDVVSRLVTAPAFAVEVGPFDAARLEALPDRGWTLLLNDADRCSPDVAALWPAAAHWCLGAQGAGWRRDDVMASLAADGGGVGPHVDSSDVFLVQARGSRRWSVELGFVDEAEERLRTRDADGCCRTLADFRADAAWTLEPGDLLYVPPRLPHDGVALGDGVSSTFSFGLRTYAPRPLAWRWADEALAPAADEVDVLADPAWDPADGATVPAAALATAKDAVRAAVDARLADGDGFAAWFGGLVTAPRAVAPDEAAAGADWDDALAASLGGDIVALDDADALAHAAGARFARVPAEDGVLLCANGSCRRLDPALGDFVGRLASTPAIDLADIRADLDASQRARSSRARPREAREVPVGNGAQLGRDAERDEPEEVVEPAPRRPRRRERHGERREVPRPQQVLDAGREHGEAQHGDATSAFTREKAQTRRLSSSASTTVSPTASGRTSASTPRASAAKQALPASKPHLTSEPAAPRDRASRRTCCGECDITVQNRAFMQAASTEERNRMYREWHEAKERRHAYELGKIMSRGG
ncbi:hypothetical protein JL721_2017 [Aureococcus anophagefferens]|nr:hypothetical protein JL721_2017 [Aureococcus anophagefferens]